MDRGAPAFEPGTAERAKCLEGESDGDSC
jgi:hypothetical protein